MTADDNRALVPSQERPSFSADDLAQINSSAYADADDAITAARNAISSGAFTVAEAKRHWNLTDAEVAELAKPRARTKPPSELAIIDSEIAKLDALRKSDRRTYWGDPVQNRLAELYAARELVAAGVPAEMPKEVLDDWGRSPQGVAHHFGVARAAATAALEQLDEAEQVELQYSFDNLPASARSTVLMFLGVEPSGKWRTSRADEVKRFAEGSDDGRELVREWGDKAGQNLGIARGRIEMMAKSAKSKDDRDAGLAWLDGLPSAQFRAVINALLP